MEKCIICNEKLDSFDKKYAIVVIKHKIVCSGCAEAIFYSFSKDFFNKHAPHFSIPEYVEEWKGD